MTADWQPIENAPSDGSWVLLYSDKWPIWSYPMVGWRHRAGDEWEFPAHPQWSSEMSWPTHWMPLPEPPAKPEDERRDERAQTIA